MHASRTLRAYGIADAHQPRTDGARRGARRSSRSTCSGCSPASTAATTGPSCIGLLLILGTGFLLVRADEATVGAVTAAALLLPPAVQPDRRAADPLRRGPVGGRLADPAGRARSAAADRPVDEPATPGRRRHLAVRGLHHEYVAGRPAVDEADLDVRPGERVAVVGASGAGKTTLGAAVAGRLAPTRGEVRPRRRAARRTSTAPGRPPVALVSQEVHVFAGTVRDNLTLAAPARDDAALERRCARSAPGSSVRGAARRARHAGGRRCPAP